MGDTKPDSTDITDFSNKQYSNTAAAADLTLYPSSFTTDPGSETSESTYQNTNWTTQWGAYFQISEYGGMIDRKAQYVVGKGFKIPGLAERITNRNKKILENIRGNGKQTFNGIMYNAVRVYTVGGDFFAEIIRNKRGDLKNLKPLNPSTVKVHANKNGIITGYEVFPVMTEPTAGTQKGVVKLAPDEMFHLMYNPLADQIHGQSVSDKLQPLFDMRRESMKDMRVVFHRYVKPLIISSVDTDDIDEIKAYKEKLDKAMEKGENLVVPKGVLDSMDRMSVPANSTLDPLPWLSLLQREFVKAEGIPMLVSGVSSGGTESESKILYLSWQQVVEFNQMFLEEQIKAQLGIDIEFEFPADIAPMMAKDEAKDVSPKNNDVRAGAK